VQPPDSLRIQRVAAIGAGQAGRRFALRCALAGFEVVLEDVMPANLRRAEAEFADLSLSNVEFALTVEDAVRNADLAIDFVPDELESKLEIFCLIDRMAPPRTIICTPSDALSITDLASCTYRAERCFAVRGDLGGDTGLRLLRPLDAALDTTLSVEAFFQAAGFHVSVESDPDQPALVKNIQFC
jgi:3-hydroxybutyryl-CoA dehydrogenase